MPNESEQERQEQLSLYVFGLLERDEAASLEQQLASNPAWQSELRAMEDTLSALAEPVAVPPGSAERLLARVRADQAASAPANRSLGASPGGSGRRLVGPLVALGLAAAVAAVLLLPRLNASPERRLAEYQAQPGAVTFPLTAKDGQNLGTAVRLNDGRAFVLLAADAPQGKVYQAWQVVGSAPVSLGVFQGRSFLSRPLGGGVTLAVSVEPPQGSPQPTTAPILAQTL
ncbi:anti-sigma factor [Deinococcus irradiatisoli]|uniref:Regulator of SigK n=1 Tax=Deinococcus irradiatisoli TaxID=2202254 RepID=A0A2Z3JH75_9DEIO|nr:anti-sigma factor [Deinococcus irradiatisoli]AWN22871.1 anti-sigma factor [Deinococcus irradiatisoli]